MDQKSSRTPWKETVSKLFSHISDLTTDQQEQKEEKMTVMPHAMTSERQ